MAKVTVEGENLLIKVEGLDKLWALTSHLTIPLAHVRGAMPDPAIAQDHRGWRGPGTYVPGVVTAGTFHLRGDRIFWDVHDASKALVIDLDNEDYRRLIIEVDDPRATTDVIERALHSR